MKLPDSFTNSSEWTLVGPMGPQIPESLLSYPVLGVDGGAHFSPKMDIWVGDGDSYKNLVNCDHIFNFPTDKNVSDFALALSFFETTSSATLHCWGFLGGRTDHEILNFGAALNFLEKNPDSHINFYRNDGKLVVKCFGSGEWKLNYQGTFSVICLRAVKIKLIGACRYQLKNETTLAPLSSLALSNVAQGQFSLLNDGPTMIFYSENE